MEKALSRLHGRGCARTSLRGEVQVRSAECGVRSKLARAWALLVVVPGLRFVERFSVEFRAWRKLCLGCMVVVVPEHRFVERFKSGVRSAECGVSWREPERLSRLCPEFASWRDLVWSSEHGESAVSVARSWLCPDIARRET